MSDFNVGDKVVLTEQAKSLYKTNMIVDSDGWSSDFINMVEVDVPQYVHSIFGKQVWLANGKFFVYDHDLEIIDPAKTPAFFFFLLLTSNVRFAIVRTH